MDDNYDDTFSLKHSFEDEYYINSEKSIDNEDIKNIETKIVNKDVNNGSNDFKGPKIININNNNNLNKNDYNEYLNYNNINIQYNTEKPNVYNYDQNEINELNKYCENNRNASNENCFNGEGDLLQVNIQKYCEQIENKKTSNTSINTVHLNGKQINTLNEVVSKSLNDLFHTNDINLDKKKDMQLLKKKKKRRTKKEVEEEKRLKLQEIKIKKKLGRKSNDNIGNDNLNNEHTKFNDDNIMKKINSYFLEDCRNWLNSSFLNNNGEFESLKSRKRQKKEFLKISPKIITTNLKKENALIVMNEKFKTIFSKNISQKYRNYDNNQNEQFIKQIYEDKNQPFVIFILELTFLQLFNYFNGQDNGDNFKKHFLAQNFNENLVDQFLNNFNKIEKFLRSIKSKDENGNLSPESIQEYVQRISILCLNYQEWFKNKFTRGKNKRKE